MSSSSTNNWYWWITISPSSNPALEFSTAVGPVHPCLCMVASLPVCFLIISPIVVSSTLGASLFCILRQTSETLKYFLYFSLSSILFYDTASKNTEFQLYRANIFVMEKRKKKKGVNFIVKIEEKKKQKKKKAISLQHRAQKLQMLSIEPISERKQGHSLTGFAIMA